MYEVVRALHENEPVDKISEHVERLVNFLKRDEGEETKKDGQVDVNDNVMTEEEDEDGMIVEV